MQRKEKENEIIPQSFKMFSERNLKLAIYQLIKFIYIGSQSMWSDIIERSLETIAMKLSC